MTNFNINQRRARYTLTPETAIAVLPIAAGLALSLLGVTFGAIPLAIDYHKQKLAVDDINRKISDLPLMRRQLDEAISQYNLKLDQQERLLSLLSGTTKLRTWFATVNRIADSHQVNVLIVDPQSIDVYVPPPSDSASPSSAPTKPASVDPLLVPNVERHSAVITFQGSFPNLLSMLRTIELLDPIVAATDMHLESVPPAISTSFLSKTSIKSSPLQARLTIKFLAYGRRINTK